MTFVNYFLHCQCGMGFTEPATLATGTRETPWDCSRAALNPRPARLKSATGFESLHAHVKFLNGAVINPGDEVLVHGEPVMAPYGEVVREQRTATITRASSLEQLWTRMTGGFEMMELCEFSFSEEVSV